MCQTSSKITYKQTNKQTNNPVLLFLCFIVCLSFVSVRGVHPMRGRSAIVHRNLREGQGIPKSINRYTKFDQSINKKITNLKYCHQMSHFKAKMHQINKLDCWRLSVCVFVYLCICVLIGV